MKGLYSAAMLFLACAFAYGEEAAQDFFEIKAGINPERATVGYPLEYTIAIEGGGSENIQIKPSEDREVFPEEDSENPVPLYVIEKVSREITSSSLIVVMTITYYRTGVYALPELEILGTDNIRISYKTPTVAIDAVNKNGEFAEAEAPIELSGSYRRLMLLILAVLLLAAAAVFIGRYIIKLRTQKKQIPQVRPIEVFMEAVDRLNAAKLISEGRMDEYSFAMSEIFRRFLSDNFGFDASEMTTDEIYGELRRVLDRRREADLAWDIKEKFNLWDLAKFAEFVPSAEVMLESHEKALKAARRLSRIELSAGKGQEQ